jgi:hypothetical protein
MSRTITTHFTLTTLSALTLALGLLSACDSSEDADVTERTEVEEIIDNLELAGYPSDEIDISDEDEVIVGGDAVVSLQASREMVHDHDEDGFRQYRTTNMVSSTVEYICVNINSIAGDFNVVSGVLGAMDRFNDLGLGFTLLIGSGIEPHCDATITIVLQDGLSSRAGFPSNGLPYNQVKVGDDIYKDSGADALRHVIMHELGHCVGLRHTDYFNRSYSCGTGGNEGAGTDGAIHIVGTTPGYDPDSVMNSCYSGNEDGEWSVFDEFALKFMY